MFLQAPRQFSDSYKCDAGPTKRGSRKRKLVVFRLCIWVPVL